VLKSVKKARDDRFFCSKCGRRSAFDRYRIVSKILPLNNMNCIVVSELASKAWTCRAVHVPARNNEREGSPTRAYK
jgi:hypothetical protein